MADITNEVLLKEIRRLEMRIADTMKRIQQMERNIIAASGRPQKMGVGGKSSADINV